MGIRENKVEKYLDSEVIKIGGITRKWVSPGHDGVPDRIVFMPNNHITFVEIKTDDGTLSNVQKREHERLTAQGVKVVTVYGHSDIDELIRGLK